MKPHVRICVLLTFAGGALNFAANASPPTGFSACAACHTSDGTVALGPSIKGVYGRKAGTAKGFPYSPAMKRANVIWDDKTLDAFLADPQIAIPGNLMPFPGIADAKQRAEIIEYLQRVK